ncbi:MAG: beta-glucosidase [Cellulomonadaceae bacterium]|nr:beta-glucosidase [Cellulomonadaceae bacterium]
MRRTLVTLPSVASRHVPTELDDLRAVARTLPLEDRIALLTGRNMWSLRGIESIGLREVAFSDGPVGVRGLGLIEGETSVLFPSPSAISATWDRGLAFEVGQAFAVEARGHGVDVVLAPQVNIQRTPVAGRHFECYSEDPYLTSVVGAHVVGGIQDQGVAACVKHFVANDSETDRTTVISQVDPQTLREVYLAPFDAAVQAGAWSVMAAYNQTDDGTETSPMTAHHHLLTDVLKGDLGFDGVVVSDWVATRTTVQSALGGLDVVMPGPGGPWEGKLLEAVKAGLVPEEVIDDKVARILLLARRVGALDRTATPLTYSGDIRALVRRAAATGTVVLRNASDTAVWDRTSPASIALIGPNAVRPHVLGGGSSTVYPAHVVTPAEGLAARFPDAALTVSLGCDSRTMAPQLDLATRDTRITVLHFDANGRTLRTHSLDSWDGWLRDLPSDTASVDLDIDFLLTEAGDHSLQIGTVGAHRSEIDGVLVSSSDAQVGVEVILDSSINNPEGEVRTVAVDAPRRVTIHSHHRVIDAEGYGRMIRAELRHRVPSPSGDDEILAAVAAATAAEMTVVIVGTNEEVESEGWDRDTLTLPGRQDELVERVLDVAPDAIVIVNAGAPLILPWLERARTVLWAWFPGQEVGHAIADILAGAVEPAGRLPWTLPDSEANVPVPHGLPLEGVIAYAEGVHVGYRAWERDTHAPAAPFGHGLGWTTWSYVNAEALQDDDGGVSVTVTVSNSGRRAGTEVVQAYVSTAPEPGIDRPVIWLGGFETVSLAPGDTAAVTVAIPRRQLEVWDVPSGAWKLPARTYTVHVGRSVTDIRLDTAVQIGDVTTGRSAT